MGEREPPAIERYSFGSISVGGRSYASDLIILPDRIVADWWREEGHSLSVGDLRAVFDAKPELLIVGTGASGMMGVPADTRSALERAGIGLLAESTADAVATYNRLRGTTRLAAAFHLTC